MASSVCRTHRSGAHRLIVRLLLHHTGAAKQLNRTILGSVSHTTRPLGARTAATDAVTGLSLAEVNERLGALEAKVETKLDTIANSIFEIARELKAAGRLEA